MIIIINIRKKNKIDLNREVTYKMNEIVFKVLTNSKVYFCKKNNDITTSSVKVMLECFDVFIIEEGWLFYRLREDCVEKGYLDKDECMIGLCEEYDQMICMGKIFNNDVPVEIFESMTWIEEDEFNLNKKNGTLKLLINEMCQIEQMDDNNNNVIDVIDNVIDNDIDDDINDIDDDIEEKNIIDEKIINSRTENFKHGYSSSGTSEESSINNDNDNGDDSGDDSDSSN